MGLAQRLLIRRAAILLGRNTIVSTFVFAFDLALLWLLVEFGGMGKIAAAALAFLVANVLHYVIARHWVFQGTERRFASGLLYFLTNAVIGFGVTLAAFALLLEISPFGYLVDRTLASVVAGLVVFVLNAVLNFRSL